MKKLEASFDNCFSPLLHAFSQTVSDWPIVCLFNALNAAIKSMMVMTRKANFESY